VIIFEASKKSYRKQIKQNYELLKSLRYVICNVRLHFGYTGWTFWLYRWTFWLHRVDVLVIQSGRFGYTGLTFWLYRMDVLVIQSKRFGCTEWTFWLYRVDVLVIQSGRFGYTE
jgi:hypothetical protein